MKRHKNIRLIRNPRKLSEGRGMSKDIGVNNSKGEIVVFLDHDNILSGRDWLSSMLFPFKNDKNIMAVQSLLKYSKSDSPFIKYVNAVGVEDAFAIPYSLVAQVSLYPKKFNLVKNSFYVHKLSSEKVLFGGANGCAFRKQVFTTIGGYTRDVDVFASMAETEMIVAVSKNSQLYHKTASSLSSFLIKKAIYFHRFISKEYSDKKFQWTQPGLANQARFFLMILYNLSLVGPGFIGFKKFFSTWEWFWIMHPFYIFFMTLEYCLITLFKIKNFVKYKNSFKRSKS
jgi:GT2 family glycosyltransferase